MENNWKEQGVWPYQSNARVPVAKVWKIVHL